MLFNSTEGASDLRELYKYSYDQEESVAPWLTCNPYPRTNKWEDQGGKMGLVGKKFK